MEMISAILSYTEILFLIVAMCGMVLIFIKSEKKTEKLLWMGKSLVIPFILLASVINLFIIFSYSIRFVYDYELVQNIASFFSLIGSALFLAIIVFKKKLLKYA